MNTPSLAFGLLVLLGAPALADVVHLTNGRLIEGRVVESRQGKVHIEVQGGRIVLPASSIDHIEDCATPEEEYARRARATNMNDSEAVARLASWASARGLGEQANHLRALSLGLDLEHRVSRAQRTRRASDWMDIFRWCRDHGLSAEVQRWVVEQGAAVDEAHPAVLDAVRDLEVTHREEPRRDEPAAKGPAPGCASEDGERVAVLERELQQRDVEEQALKERVAQLERDKRPTRRRRNPSPAVLPRDLTGAPDAGPIAPPAPAPVPAVRTAR